MFCAGLFGCSTLTKDVAYKNIVRLCVECGIPHTEKDRALLDAIQNRAARLILKSRWDPESLRWSKSSMQGLYINIELAFTVD